MPEEQYQDSGETEDTMSAERGWIGDPQPPVEWRDSHYSRQADRQRLIDPDGDVPCGG
jgi:hypothetical protein